MGYIGTQAPRYSTPVETSDINSDNKINLQDFYRAINLKDSASFDDISTEIETLGGFLIEKVKKIPKVGQVINHESLKFVIEIVDKKRIKQVKLIMPKNK